MKASLKKIKKESKAFFDAHNMVDDFFWGDFIRMYSDNQIKHSTVIVQPVRTTQMGRRNTPIQLLITYSDRLYSDFRNLDDVHSQALEVLDDFVHVVNSSKRWRSFINGNTTADAQTFTQRSGDLVAGAAMTITLDINSVSDLCAIPAEGYDYKKPDISNPCADGEVNINQSDGTLIATVTVESGGLAPYNIADSPISINSDLLINLKATDALNIPIVDTNGDAVATTIDGSNVVVDDLPCAPSGTGEKLLKTGQTTSYRAGDDGDFQAGRDIDFFILPSNNPFENNQRFTGITGGYYDEDLSGYYDKDGAATTEALAFPDDIFLDWSQYNGSTCLGYRRGLVNVDINWEDAIDDAVALSIGSYTSGWRLPNLREMLSLCIFDRGDILDYTSLNIGSFGYAYWTSTTNPSNTNNAYQVANGGNSPIFNSNKTSTTASRRYVPCREFTIIGTTIT